jgi:hypothetical protein
VHVSLLFTAYASSYTHMHIHVITYIALIFWIKLKLKMPNFLTLVPFSQPGLVEEHSNPTGIYLFC